MEDMENEKVVQQKKTEEEPKPKRHKKLVIPKRAPSVVIPPRKLVYITPDKTTCTVCPCYPVEDPYVRPKKLNPCLLSPPTLYELASAVVDNLKYPAVYQWSVQQVADWMANDVGLPQYRECMLDNHINGRRLLLLEDPSHFPELNIRYLEHIKIITTKIRQMFLTDFILFRRSIGLPPRKPLTHCTIFKSRTGPTWGIRQNWTRSDILRWMKILDPEKLTLDHWDLVWYMKPDFPQTMFARIPPRTTHEFIPRYKYRKPEPCREYLVPRKFRIHRHIPDELQNIWMERRPDSPRPTEFELAAKRKQLLKKPAFVPTKPRPTRLDPPKVDLTGLSGKELLLARRLMPRKKFALS